MFFTRYSLSETLYLPLSRTTLFSSRSGLDSLSSVGKNLSSSCLSLKMDDYGDDASFQRDRDGGELVNSKIIGHLKVGKVQKDRAILPPGHWSASERE